MSSQSSSGKSPCESLRHQKSLTHSRRNLETPFRTRQHLWLGLCQGQPFGHPFLVYEAHVPPPLSAILQNKSPRSCAQVIPTPVHLPGPPQYQLAPNLSPALPAAHPRRGFHTPRERLTEPCICNQDPSPSGLRPGKERKRGEQEMNREESAPPARLPSQGSVQPVGAFLPTPLGPERAPGEGEESGWL